MMLEYFPFLLEGGVGVRLNMKNLEIKSKYDDLKLAAKIAKKLKATYKGVLNQTDTYFNVKSGRLKMRLINNKKYELIHYHRTNSKNARFCNYEIIRLNNGKQVYELLTNALGIKCVIVKKRILYIFENVRIHFDTVKNLGKFLEFEVVCRSKQDENEAVRKMKMLKEIFHIDNKKLLPYSYSDMLLMD